MPIPLNHSGAGVITLKAPTSGTLTLTLPTADGTNGQVLSTNGSGVLSFITAGGGGGLTGFTAAESTAAPNGTVYVDSLTASAASTNADVAFVAKGTGATLAQVPTSTTAGGNKRGTYATDWQKNRLIASQVASGDYSVVAGGQDNAATGNYSSVGGGNGNSASGTFSSVFGGFGNSGSNTGAGVFGGNSNSATNAYAVIIGGQNSIASGAYSAVLGGSNNLSSGNLSTVIGGQVGSARSIVGNFVTPASDGPIAFSYGIQQSALLVLGVQTTDATATVLRSNTSAAGTTNQVVLSNNAAYYFRGEVIAGVTGGGDTKGWYIEGVIKRGANAASTALVGTPSVTSLYGDSGASTWVVTATANTSIGCLTITVTGAAATTIRWVAQIRTTEMTY